MRFLKICILACALQVALLPRFASAAGDDVVLLTNGGRLRGTILEEDPQKGVRFLSLDGSTRTLAPSEVSELRYHGQARAPAAAAAALSPVAPPLPPVAAQPPNAASPGAEAQARHVPQVGASAHAIQLGLRSGWAIPAGSFFGSGTSGSVTTVSQPLGTNFVGKIPILLEAGYAVTSNIVLGVHAQYGFIVNETGADSPCPSPIECSDHDLELGIQAQYRFMPGRGVDPWLGVGVGYEIESYSVAAPDLPSVSGILASGSGTLRGPQYLKLQGGADLGASSGVSIGPFASFSLGSYTSATFDGVDDPVPFTSLHEWLSIGVRGSFGISP